MKLLSILSLVFFSLSMSAQTDSLIAIDANSPLVNEKLPRFYSMRCESFGGEGVEQCAREVMIQTIYSELKYPKKARKKGISGTVIINFIIKKDGKMSNTRVVRSVHPLLDDEALRVVAMLDKWVPGIQKGVPVDVNFNIPLKFAFSNDKK